MRDSENDLYEEVVRYCIKLLEAFLYCSVLVMHVYGKHTCMIGEKPGIFRVTFETKKNEE